MKNEAEEHCKSFLSCECNICPLDRDICVRNFIPKDKICRRIVDYLEGKDTGFNDRIKETEIIWKKKIGEGRLKKRVNDRKRLREVFPQALPKAVA
jgi:hypothetical protein